MKRCVLYARVSTNNGQQDPEMQLCELREYAQRRELQIVEEYTDNGVSGLHDQNILKRHVQPAARKLGLHVTWRCLRTSHATWLVQAGADPKSVQGQMRHSRITTTMDIYAQIVPAAQRQAIEKLSEFAKTSVPKLVTLLSQ
jgi:integrase